ncbi:hypothetical protein KEM54_000482 [Ascosphaera aggregata]|nr:hypothetical protein KEM54_000482 [Ascosphaera aggregata]
MALVKDNRGLSVLSAIFLRLQNYGRERANVLKFINEKAMTNQGIHAHHHHRVRRQIDILNNFTKKDLVGVGPPVRGENNNDDYSGNGGDDGDNDGSSQPEHADKAETSKSEQADKPRVKTIEVTEAKPTTQVSSTASKAESHKALPTSEIITHSTGLPKTQATSTAQPLITTINFNDITHDLQSTPTLTSRDAFSTIQHADATTELVPPTSAALLDSASGLSGGAKAGVAMGVIAWVGVVTALVAFLILRRRRRQPRGTEELVDNEKSPPPAPPQNMTGRPKQSLAIFNPSSPHQDLPAEPPRLAEVRPGSQFSPFKGRASMAPFSDGRIVEETPDEVAAANATALFAPKPTTPEPLSRNLTGSPASPPQTSGDHHQNPFGDPENIVVSSPEEKTKPPPRPVSKDLRNPKQESNDIPEPVHASQ